MKKIGSTLLCILVILIIFPLNARADVGPKPSIVIDFNGLEGETYYVTLLSDKKSTGPYSALNDSNRSYARYQEGDEDYVIFLKFSEYRDVDGYYFLQYFQNCSQTHRFSWTYYPPQKFKILLYFPEKDRFVVSNEHFERYAFDSYFTANVFAPDPSFQGEFEVKVVKSYNYTYEMLSLLTRIILTIVLELAIALMFGFWERKQLRLIALVNVVTQIALNLTLSIIDYQLGLMAFLIFFVLLEIAVLVAEAVIYTLYLQKISKKEIPSWKPALYALTANAVSFALGLGLAYWIPGIF